MSHLGLRIVVSAGCMLVWGVILFVSKEMGGNLFHPVTLLSFVVGAAALVAISYVLEWAVRGSVHGVLRLLVGRPESRPTNPP